MTPIDRERPAIAKPRAALAEIMKGAFKRWKSATVDHVSSLAKADAPKDPWLTFTDDETKQITSALGDLLTAGVDGALDQLVQAGMSVDADVMDVVNQGALDFSNTFGGELVTGVEQTTQDAIGKMVSDALANGDSVDDLADDLADSFYFDDDRADMIARTETAMADSAGNMAVYQGAGVDKKQWILGPGSCDVCQGNADDGVIDFDDSFSSGDDAAPAHPNCTCDVLPIFSSDDSDDDSGDDD